MFVSRIAHRASRVDQHHRGGESASQAVSLAEASRGIGRWRLGRTPDRAYRCIPLQCSLSGHSVASAALHPDWRLCTQIGKARVQKLFFQRRVGISALLRGCVGGCNTNDYAQISR